MRRSLRSWLWRVPIDQEVEEELAFHLEMRRREGKPLEAAEVERVRRACLEIARKRDREMRLTQWLDDVAADIRFAFRQMRASPGFTFVATLTLALGIGANSAIFALADVTLLRPLPFADPGRVVAVVERSAAAQRLPLSPPTFRDIREQSRSFEALAAVLSGAGGGPLVTAPDGTVETVERQTVTTGFFEVIGVAPVAGRTFRSEDEAPAPTVVIFSESLWRSRFAADVSLIGKTVRLNGEPFTLVGVVPDAAQLTRPARMWTLIAQVPEALNQRVFRFFETVGRLKPGVTLDAARSDVEAIGARIAREHSDAGAGFGLAVTPVRDWLMGPDLQLTSLLLLGVVGFVLLMCCANVANLLLARANVRSRELALRTALGAGRGRVITQMLIESLVLSLVGAAFGLAIGAAILRAAPVLIPPGLLPAAVTIGFDARIVAFGIGAAAIVGVLFGLGPAWQATRTSLARTLASESRSSTGAGRFRGVLVSGEVAAAVLLLCGAGLLLRTLLVLVSVDPGYRVEASRVLTLDFSLSFGPNTPRPTPESLMQFYDTVAREIGERPEVKSVGWTSSLPYGSTSELGMWTIEVVGDPSVSPESRPTADVAVADDGYFRTLDLPIVAGRRFTDRDAADTTPVCIVNEAFVRRVLGGRNPIGIRIVLHGPRTREPLVKEIVGVARSTSGRAAEPQELLQVYMPLRQFPTGDVYLVAEAATGPAEALTPIVRAIVARHDPNTPVRRDRTLEFLSVASTAGYRFRAAMVGTFAGLALVLALIGVFGVLAYSVQQRRREFGVRIALGATGSSVLTLVLRSASTMIAAGTLIGLALAFALSKTISAFLFGVQPIDPVTFLGAVLLLIVTAALAAAAPAWRAAHVDPVVAFRTD
jgi:putative ABC transport system permease protein